MGYQSVEQSSPAQVEAAVCQTSYQEADAFIHEGHKA